MPIRQESPRTRRTRDAVIAAAVDLLVAGGTGAVTVEAVVQASGVARSTIYRHWPTRTDVVAAAFSALMPPMPQADPTGCLADQLEAVLGPLAGQMAGQTYAALVPSFLAGAARDPELAPFRDRFVHAQCGPLRGVLERAVRQGDLPAGTDLEESMSRLVGPLLFQRVVLDAPVDADMARRLVRSFLASHSPSTSDPVPRDHRPGRPPPPDDARGPHR